VIAIARLTLATMAADSGVLRGMILMPSSFDIRFPGEGEQACRHEKAAPVSLRL
jgi:hypothetical protein